VPGAQGGDGYAEAARDRAGAQTVTFHGRRVP
jgi:hypothetical protein